MLWTQISRESLIHRLFTSSKLGQVAAVMANSITPGEGGRRLCIENERHSRMRPQTRPSVHTERELACSRKVRSHPWTQPVRCCGTILGTQKHQFCKARSHLRQTLGFSSLDPTRRNISTSLQRCDRPGRTATATTEAGRAGCFGSMVTFLLQLI